MENFLEKSKKLELRFREYYRSYYLEQLGLVDWEKRFLSFRSQEEKAIGEKLERFFVISGINSTPKKVLVVGCGTGAELLYFAARPDVNVFGIDPFDSAIEICKLKADLNGFSVDIRKEAAEQMSFEDNTFDLVICFTVLEHVQNVDATLKEIFRVMALGGRALIVLPDYAYPEEQHYKVITLPPAFFPWFVKLHLRFLNRPVKFFDTLNLLTKKSLKKHLNKLGIKHNFFRVYTYKTVSRYLIKAYSFLFAIDRTQVVVLIK